MSCIQPCVTQYIFLRVDQLIINQMLMIEHLFVSSSYVLHFEWIKMSWEPYLKLLKSSSKPKGKGLMKKITRRKKNFPNFQILFFFFFLLFGPLLLSNLVSFLFFIHLKRFKMLYERHLKFYSSSLNSNNNKTTNKEFFGCLRTGLSSVWWFVFLNSWPPIL